MYRLPTEAEWEYACRAGTQTKYYSGDTEHDLDRAGWYSGNSGGQTYPVAHKEPNAFGLYDMHGNVGEWCQDWLDSFDWALAIDPHGPSSPPYSAPYRVYRGGSYCDAAGDCRAAYRFGFEPGVRFHDLGFRLALPPRSPGEPIQ